MRAGDRIYVVTNQYGTLYLAGRMTAERIVGQREAERQLGGDLSPATEHVIGVDGTPMKFDRAAPDGVVRRLQFGDGRPLVFRRGRLDQQTLRGVRRLTSESASLLDALLESDGRGETADAIELRVIENVADLADNFSRFERDARRHRERTASILRSTSYWVHDKNSDAFGPGKFLGYKGMGLQRFSAEGGGDRSHVLVPGSLGGGQRHRGLYRLRQYGPR